MEIKYLKQEKNEIDVELDNLTIAEILNELSKTMPELLYPRFLDILQLAYNEPSKEVEKLLIEFIFSGNDVLIF